MVGGRVLSTTFSAFGAVLEAPDMKMQPQSKPFQVKATLRLNAFNEELCLSRIWCGSPMFGLSGAVTMGD
jgi:hypothetical protein